MAEIRIKMGDLTNFQFNAWAHGGAEVDQREVFGLKGGNDSVNVLD